MFVIETEIGRDAATVFTRLARVEDTPLWYSAVERVERLAAGPIGAGSMFRLHRKLPGGPAINDVEIVDYVPSSLFAMVSRNGPTPFAYRYSLSPGADGGTLLKLEGEISGAGLSGAASLLAPLAPVLFERGMRTNLAAFKRLVEAG
jgi:hypothetical protein